MADRFTRRFEALDHWLREPRAVYTWTPERTHQLVATDRGPAVVEPLSQVAHMCRYGRVHADRR